MGEPFDALETRDPEMRERDFFARFAAHLADALERAPGLRRHIGLVEAVTITSREALAALPVLRKSRLMEWQAEDPPFGGFAPADALAGGRVFLSPGPLYEPQGIGADPWGGARALFAAGFRRGDIVLNSFAYHLTPGGFILDEAARALGCCVFPAGPGNAETLAAAISALRPVGYIGTPDFLKVILDKAEAGSDASSIRRALVSGGALFPSLRQDYEARGIRVSQAYATADLGFIAYESEGLEGLIVNEDILVEIVRPGTDDPVGEGEVGEVVVTTLNPAYPLVRFGTGDLSAVLPGRSPCGRTNMRLRGWMGRADQRTKVRGMFVDPAQVATLLKRHSGVARARLVVTREGEQDVMQLLVEPRAGGAAPDLDAVAADWREIAKLRGDVEAVAPGSLPNDGKVVEDRREYG